MRRSVMALGCWRNGETALSPKSVPLEGPHPFRKRPLETFRAAFLYGECCNQSSMSAKAFGKGGMGSAPRGFGEGRENVSGEKLFPPFPNSPSSWRSQRFWYERRNTHIRHRRGVHRRWAGLALRAVYAGLPAPLQGLPQPDDALSTAGAWFHPTGCLRTCGKTPSCAG